MNKNDDLRLRDSDTPPTDEILEQTLGGAYAAYVAFQKAVSDLRIEQVWQWYTPHKAWFARGQYSRQTPKGAGKEKTLYWLHVFDGHFNVAVWFKEKNRAEALKADVGAKTKRLITGAATMGKVPTFPVVFDVHTTEPLTDIYKLIECKKRIEP